MNCCHFDPFYEFFWHFDKTSSNWWYLIKTLELLTFSRFRINFHQITKNIDFLCNIYEFHKYSSFWYNYIIYRQIFHCVPAAAHLFWSDGRAVACNPNLWINPCVAGAFWNVKCPSSIYPELSKLALRPLLLAIIVPIIYNKLY